MANENCKPVSVPTTDNTPLDCPIFVQDKCVIVPEGIPFLLTNDNDSLEEFHVALVDKLILMNNTLSAKEDSLGNPPFDGYVLSSTASGTRSWVPNAGGSGGGHIIQDEGSNLAQRTFLNFTGPGVTVTDDSGSDATVVSIVSGGLDNLIEDTTPQLGGNLDLNGFNITGLVIGTNVQAYSSILQNTTASFTTTLLTKLNGIEVNAKDDQDAVEVPFSPYLTITSTNVQFALQELKDEVDSISAGGLSDGDKGDITVSGGGTTWVIDNNTITSGKIQDGAVINSKVPTNGLDFNRLNQITEATFLGRAAGLGTGDVGTISAAQARSILNVENGATGDQNATEVPIADTGTYFTGGNVELALQETGASLANKLENIVEDATPQLGGTLDAQSNNIIGTGNIFPNSTTQTLGDNTNYFLVSYVRDYRIKDESVTNRDWLLSVTSTGLDIRSENTPDSNTFTANYTINLTGTPTNGTDLITKSYADTNYTPKRSYVDSTSNGLTGTQNGVNTTFTVSQSVYDPGSLLVFIGGFPMSDNQGITETTPGSGIFDFDVAPESTDIIIVQYSN